MRIRILTPVLGLVRGVCWYTEGGMTKGGLPCSGTQLCRQPGGRQWHGCGGCGGGHIRLPLQVSTWATLCREE